MSTPNAAKIAEIGLTYSELGSKEIMELFSVSRSTAIHYKQPVIAEMIKRGVKTWNPRNINTKIAFEIWGFDVGQAEASCKRLKRLDF